MRFSVWQENAPVGWRLIAVREALDPSKLAKKLAEEGIEGKVRIVDPFGAASLWECCVTKLYYARML